MYRVNWNWYSYERLKIHKMNVPLGLIRSSINMHSYKISQLLVPLLHFISSGIGIWLQILFLYTGVAKRWVANSNVLIYI